MHGKLNSMTLHVRGAGGPEPGYLPTEDSANTSPTGRKYHGTLISMGQRIDHVAIEMPKELHVSHQRVKVFQGFCP
jgi:hypothetical protein